MRGGHTMTASVAVTDLFGMEAGAQQIERVDGVSRVGVGLLFDDVPARADVERCWPDAKMQRLAR